MVGSNLMLAGPISLTLPRVVVSLEIATEIGSRVLLKELAKVILQVLRFGVSGMILRLSGRRSSLMSSMRPTQPQL
ncbi:putative ribonuclease H protein [Senna tora]|uniref:Putative ribonuclease H protein n=1 Tax=Senna tora TaxID=362788 RepID=A0A834TUS7_9FABA|nr:putative ribonuclease H protein [Senna tora]